MEQDYKTLNEHSIWLPDNPISVAKIDLTLRKLICHKGSLTAALVALSNNTFSVNVVRQRLAVPYFHEQRKLARPSSHAALIREVELQIFDETVVYARSIIPFSLINKGHHGLADLGRTPLGHLLFRDGQIRVSKREFSIFTLESDTVTARRTPYDYRGDQILVSEFFLPSIYQYL